MLNYILVGIVVLATGTLGCRRASQDSPDATVAARVNGQAILRADVEKYFRFRSQQTPQKLNADMANLMKLEILRELITSEIMMQKAAQLKLEVSDADVEAEVQKMRGDSSEEDFKKTFEQRGFTEDDLRRDIRRSLTVEKLLENQVHSKVSVTDAEIASFYEANQESFHVKERQYHIGQIFVSPDPSLQVTNSRTDKALNPEQASSKIRMLAGRLQAGENFEQLAREYSEDAQTAPLGGDLGYQPASTLEQLEPPLKEALSSMKIGDVTPILSNPDGYRILKLLEKREPGQADLKDPQVQQSIRNGLQNRKQELLSSAFSEQMHNDARVENLLAQEILGQFQK
ncbi:MAG: SurA N-terminal domain-containing protein [Acidobacteria bacterium]|nr:SurA N-terminal domain-containing protein [Acidobacteriota bacterium]